MRRRAAAARPLPRTLAACLTRPGVNGFRSFARRRLGRQAFARGGRRRMNADGYCPAAAAWRELAVTRKSGVQINKGVVVPVVQVVDGRWAKRPQLPHMPRRASSRGTPARAAPPSSRMPLLPRAIQMDRRRSSPPKQRRRRLPNIARRCGFFWFGSICFVFGKASIIQRFSQRRGAGRAYSIGR